MDAQIGVTPAGSHIPDERNVKETIALHRSYRRIRLTREMRLSSVFSFALILAILAAKIVYLPALTLELCRWLVRLFQTPLGETAIRPIYFWSSTSFHFLVVPISAPSTTVCLVVISVSLISLLFLKRLPIPLPLVILTNLLISATGFFALLFLLIPDHFTYRAESLSELFTTVSVLVATGLPFIFWLVLLPLPIRLPRRILFCVLFECVLALLYVLKHLVYMVMCTYGTYLVIPLVILIICSLPDILYLVSLFSMTVSGVSARISRDSKLWHWT